LFLVVFFCFCIIFCIVGILFGEKGRRGGGGGEEGHHLLRA